MNDPLNLSAADWLAIERAEYEDSLYTFIVGINGEGGAWRVLEPATKLVEGFHLHSICAHLEAVSAEQIDSLCISIPPGYMKSLLVNVFWPAWEWTRQPHLRIVTASGKEEACDRDAEKMRKLVQSDWYQRYWQIDFPSVNSVSCFINQSFGERRSSSFASLTGLRADRLLLDDVLTVEAGNSEVERGKVHRKFFEQSTSRGAGEKGAIVIIAQRIHEADLIGEIMARQEAADLGFHFLTIPLEWEGEEVISTVDMLDDQFRRDPRSEMGELLLPEYQGRRWADRQRARMSAYAYSAQYQQSPIPRGESFFREEWFKLYRRGDEPAELNYYITSDHSTGHTAKSDYQVIRVWGQDTKKHWWLIDSYRERSSFNDALGVEMQDGKYALKAKGALPFIMKYKPLRWFADGDNIIRQSLPMIKDLQVELQAHCRIEIVNQGSQNKGEGAVPYQGFAEAGRVHLPEGPIGDTALAEYLAFTGRNDKMDDQVDADGLIARMATHPAVSPPVERQGRRDDYYVEGSDDGESPIANCF